MTLGFLQEFEFFTGVLDSQLKALEAVKAWGRLAFIEVRRALGARVGLGRPATTPEENRRAFMDLLRGDAA